jgi:hypothetical protein
MKTTTTLTRAAHQCDHSIAIADQFVSPMSGVLTIGNDKRSYRHGAAGGHELVLDRGLSADFPIGTPIFYEDA